MDSNIDTLVEDVFALFQYGHISTPELLSAYGGRVAEILSSSLEDSLTPREFKLRLSAIGRPSRQIYYESVDAPHEPFSPEVFFKFQYGHLLEEMFLFLAKEAGHDVQNEQGEITAEGIKGHCDAVIDGVLCDVKSASPYGYVKFKNGTIRENDGFNYIPQLAAYYQGGGYTKGAAFIAINKVSGQICVCKFTHEEMIAVDVKGHAARQKRVVSRPEKTPERCFEDVPMGASGNRKLPITCSYCRFKYHCWRDSNGGQGLKTYIYSNGPTYLTTVKREPKVFDVEAPKLVTNKDK